MKKRKNKPGAGRPHEGRAVLYAHVLPATLERIASAKNDAANTLGKVIDARFAAAK